MRVKLDEFDVENPKAAMRKFQEALAQVVKVPKNTVKSKRKRAKARYKKKRGI